MNFRRWRRLHWIRVSVGQDTNGDWWASYHRRHWDGGSSTSTVRYCDTEDDAVSSLYNMVHDLD